MTDKPWSLYPPGVPAEIDPDRYIRRCRAVRGELQRYADAPAFTNLGETLTFAEADRLSRYFAAYLQSLPALSRGARVAVMLPNTLQYVVAMLGILRAGLVVVNVNPMYTQHELEHQLKDSGALAIVVLENFAHTLSTALPQTGIASVIVTRLGDHCGTLKRLAVNFAVKHVKRLVPPYRIAGAVAYRDALAEGRSLAYVNPGLRGTDTAFLQYTGGTTGVAKGCAAHASQHGRERAPGGVAWGRAVLRQRRRRGRDAAAALSRVLAHRESALLHRARRPQPADHRSPRHADVRVRCGRRRSRS
jgi:long-chain acyl-CoA synthetase